MSIAIPVQSFLPPSVGWRRHRKMAAIVIVAVLNIARYFLQSSRFTPFADREAVRANAVPTMSLKLARANFTATTHDRHTSLNHKNADDSLLWVRMRNHGRSYSEPIGQCAQDQSQGYCETVPKDRDPQPITSGGPGWRRTQRTGRITWGKRTRDGRARIGTRQELLSKEHEREPNKERDRDRRRREMRMA